MVNKITQGSITIKRLRRGYTLSLHFENLTGVALYQGVDSAGNVAPSWKPATAGDYSKCPQLKPVLDATGNIAPTIASGKWSYLGVELAFDKTGACTTTSLDCNKKFRLTTDGTYTLIICDNLASSENNANDVLSFSCTARVAGAEEQNLQGTVDVIISPLGSSSWQGIVGFDSNRIDESHTTVKLTLQLAFGTKMQQKFGYAICKAGTKPTKILAASCTNDKFDITNAITANDVDGQTTFLVYFYPEGETNVDKSVDCDGFAVLDMTDEYKIEYRFKDDKIQQVDVGQPVTVVPYVVSIDGSKTIDLSKASPVWNHQIYRKQEGGATWVPTRTDANGNPVAITTETVEVTTADTDYTDDAGNTICCDVDVVGEVSFTI